MSANQSSLFSYFQRNDTPKEKAAAGAKVAGAEATRSSSKENHGGAAKATPSHAAKRAPSGQRQCAKRKRVVSDSDDDGTGAAVAGRRPDDNGDVVALTSDTSADEEGDLSRIKQKYRAKAAKHASPATPRADSGTPKSTTAGGTPNRSMSFLGNYSYADDTPDSPRSSSVADSKNAAGDTVVFKHLTLPFLRPDHITDEHRRRPSHADYDKRTLRVPDDFMKAQSPAMRQWWTMKSRHFDTVLFFKVGKFYELYHMDAVIAVENLNIAYMKGEHAHCGFPEASFHRFSEQLVSRGYKVARVEQTETPDGLAARNQQQLRPDRVVRREICQVSTPGTRTFSPADAMVDGAGAADTAAAAASGKNLASYLVAVCERVKDGTDCVYGVCFVDTTEGLFKLGSFTDDVHRSHLRTVLAHYPPAQMLYERGRCSGKLSECLRNVCTESLLESLAPDGEFWPARRTLTELSSSVYLGAFDAARWPAALVALVEPADSLGLRERGAEAGAALAALGACLWYLRECLIDVDQVTTCRFEPLALRQPAAGAGAASRKADGCSVVLDGATLANLNIVPGGGDAAGDKCTLFAVIDKCRTPFGKRLLRQWLCAPLYDVGEIELRQRAVEDIRQTFDHDLRKQCEGFLNRIPDLPRLLQRLHTLGLKHRAGGHPDSRAVMFDAVKYDRRKILDLLSALAGFKAVQRLADCLSKKVKSELLQRLFVTDFPDMIGDIAHFDGAFDHGVAKSQGAIIPNAGVDADYDDALGRIDNIEALFNDYLSQQRRYFDTSYVTYVGTGRSRYQLEIPEAACKEVPDDFEFRSQRKGFKRFSSDRTRQLFAELCEAEAQRDCALKDIARRVMADFDSRGEVWRRASRAAGALDVLMSFAAYADSCDGDVCMPHFVQSDKPVLRIVNGSHATMAPSLCRQRGSHQFISNDSTLGPGALLLTGPNMGGKSTLMRQIGLIAVLAHSGCYVPASQCELTVIDRIFTRIGASDRILAGESTFYVELAETSAMLRHATAQSLLLIDELGRGTSTHDGTAIAGATLKHIVDAIGCRTVFSTHYHSLVQRFADEPRVQLGHMACMVERGDDAADSALDDAACGEESVTFLYKLVAGACPKSYGFNAAALAGLRTVRAREWSSLVMGGRRPTKAELKRLLTTASDEQDLSDRVLKLCFGFSDEK